MSSKPIHVVIWLPANFYSAVAATLVEMFELVNMIRRAEIFSFEFVSRQAAASSSSGIIFQTLAAPSRPMDILILLAVPGLNVGELLGSLDDESRHAEPILAMAKHDDAIIAAHCSASYFLAQGGHIDGKRATISWWLKGEAARRFPQVRWDPSRLLIREGKIYTCGGGFSGLELAKALVKDMGFEKEERIVRKLLVLPPSRRLQTPYEFRLEDVAVPERMSFRERLEMVASANMAAFNLAFLADQLALSPRTLSRRFAQELQTSPGQWIQDRRLEAAKELLESTQLAISEICYRVGYQDVASFSRLFSRTTGLPPGEYRRQSQ
ncbi:GlxA family transcriptional regulator [Phyllobacterium sophorae]|nr:helix-turn-helix domain-containing protein [Phyllobacterium sophorae]